MHPSPALCDDLRRDAAAGLGWPLDCAALAALADYGLTDEDIGRYFRVRTSRVTALRRNFGIAETGVSG